MTLSSLYYHSVTLINQDQAQFNSMEKRKSTSNIFVLILQEADTKSEIDTQAIY